MLSLKSLHPKLFILVAWAAIFTLFTIGGIGIVNLRLSFFGALISYSLLFYLFIKNGKILFPKGVTAYSFFLVFFLFSYFWTGAEPTTLVYFVMFLTGGIFWILFYNLKRESEFKIIYVDSLVISLGLFFGSISIYNFLTDSLVTNASGLINYAAENRSHHHIGDLWAAIVGLSVYKISQNVKKPYSFIFYILMILGIYFMAVSLSRSAYLALTTGMVFMLWNSKMEAKIKKLTHSVLAGAIILFFWSSLSKGLITQRLFYFSGIWETLKQPFGVGIGGFGNLLKNNMQLIPTFGYANIADNFFLDILAGLGILSLPFFIWFYLTSKSLFTKSDSDSTYKVLFIILTVIFMFIHVYFIPVMLWLWFMALGLLQAEGYKNFRR